VFRIDAEGSSCRFAAAARRHSRLPESALVHQMQHRSAAASRWSNRVWRTQPSGTPQNLLGLSIGPEHADDLIDDPRQALAW